MKPFLSIIIPVYNVEKYVERCLKSFYYQKGEIEIIAIDDGSTDNSGKILDNWLKKERRLRVVHKQNGGVSSARNLGIELAQAENITFIDPDDFVSESYLAVCKRILDKKAELSCFNMFKQQGKDGPYTCKKFVKNDKVYNNPKDFINYCLDFYVYFDSPVNKIYKKWIIEKFNIRFNENLKLCEDKVFNMDYLQVIKNIYITSDPIYYYFYNPNGALRKRKLTYLDDDNFIFFKKINIVKKYNLKYDINKLYDIYLDRFFINIDNFVVNGISLKEIREKLKSLEISKEILKHHYAGKLQRLQQKRIKLLLNGNYFMFRVTSRLYNYGLKLRAIKYRNK